MGRGMGGGRSAQMFLARSGELELTDAQVVKLAGIARRTEARQKSLRAQMDSGRTRFTQPGDSAARRAFAQKMRDNMTKEQAASQTDLRDALAVLTPDQQAKAWQMNARRSAAGGVMRARNGRGAGARGRTPGMRPGAGMRPRMPQNGMGARGRQFPDDMGPGGAAPGAPGARGARPMRPGRPPFEGDVPNQPE